MSQQQPSVWTQRYYPRDDGVAFDRVIFFSDAVYAIALTLIAVEIGIPEVEGDAADPHVLWEAFAALGPRIGAFVVAFVWIAIYWRANHRFVMTLRRMNSTYVAATIVYLALIAFLPVPAATLGEFWSNPLAITIFALYASVVSTMEVVLIWVAIRGDLFIAPLSPAFARQTIAGALTPVVGFLVSIPVAFLLWPTAAIATWFVAAVVLGYAVTMLFPAEPPADPPKADAAPEESD